MSGPELRLLRGAVIPGRTFTSRLRKPALAQPIRSVARNAQPVSARTGANSSFPRPFAHHGILSASRLACPRRLAQATRQGVPGHQPARTLTKLDDAHNPPRTRL